MKPYDPTPEQRAAMDRAKNPKHPYRCHQPPHTPAQAARDAAERVVPRHTRLVRV